MEVPAYDKKMFNNKNQYIFNWINVINSEEATVGSLMAIKNILTTLWSINESLSGKSWYLLMISKYSAKYINQILIPFIIVINKE